MFRVFNCLVVEHDLRLVALAGLVCLGSSLLAVTQLHRAKESVRRSRALWLALAGLATGFGIWATHFIAMLAYAPSVPVAYDIGRTMLSLVLAAVITCGGMTLAVRTGRARDALLGGGAVGTGVAIMHYTGMSALEMPGRIGWHTPLVMASIALGIVLAAAALLVSVRQTTRWGSLTGALLLTAAILSHHFTAMGAVEIAPDPTRGPDPVSFSPIALTVVVAGIAAAVLLGCLAGALADRRMRDRDIRLINAVNHLPQGLIIFNAREEIVVCNARYIELFGLSAEVAKPGCTFRELIAHRKATGTFAGDVEAYCANHRDQMKGGRTVRLMAASTDGRAIELINQPLPDGGWLATFEEITERLQAEQERERNHAFLHQIIDHIPSQITVKDVRDRRYVLVNRVAEAQFGAAREEIVGRTADELFPPEAAAIIAADDERALASADGLFLDVHPWTTQGLGERFITARRIGVQDRQGETRYIINVVDDVTERKLANDRILHLAHYDALTGLPNRSMFRERLEQALDALAQGRRLAVLYLDLDNFKSVNDTLGHPAGDELLKVVATRVSGCLAGADFMARLGGDEFAVIKAEAGQDADIAELVRRIGEVVRLPLQLDGHQVVSEASIGIAIAPDHGTEPDQLLKSADVALYDVKAQGRGAWRVYEPAMYERVRSRRAMEQDLRHAVERGELELHYQPLVGLRSNAIVACEALLRWRHPREGLISPREFIPIAEESGLITQLGEWALKAACAEAASWPEEIKVAVNVSPVQFNTESFALTVVSALSQSGLAAERLELEVTEDVLIADDEAARSILRQLQDLGVRIALDDFGTGYSSLSYLQRFAFNTIKIDRCFIKDIAERGGSLPIVQAIVSIAAARSMTTTAEGVETAEQLETLRGCGCTQMQGYLFCAPKPAREIRKLLEAASPRRIVAA